MTHSDAVDGTTSDRVIQRSALVCTQSKLAKIEAKYQALVESSGQIVWMLDENAVPTDDSWRPWCDFTGLSETEWRERRWLECVHPLDRDRISRFWTARPPVDAVSEYEYRLKHVSGDWRHVSERVVPLRSGDSFVEGWIGMTKDISRAKQSQLDIADSESRYRALVEAASQIVWRTDPTGKVRRDSPTWRSFTGRSNAQYHDEGWLDAIHPDDRSSTLRSWSNAIATGQRRLVEYRLLRADGQWRWMLERSVPYGAGWVSMAVDITDAKAAEKMLADRERHLSLALMASRMVAWHLDVPSRKFVMVGGHDLLPGLTEGVDHLDVLLSAMSPAAAFQLNHIIDAADDQDTPLELEFELLGRGRPTWLSMHGRSIPSAASKDRRVFGVFQDISNRKIIEERRILLIGEIAHRGKNLLAVVQAIAAITLIGEGEVAEATGKFQERIATLGRSHSLLTDKDWYGVPLDEIVKLELGKFSDRASIDVASVILNPSAAQNCALVFHELVTNAVKYGAFSMVSGRVTVRGYPQIRDDEECLVLEWKETGGPPVTPPKRRGFGTILLRRLVSGFDTGGELEFEPDGFRLNVAMPLAMIRPVPTALAKAPA